MILSKKVKMYAGRFKKYYENLGYVAINKFMEILVSDLKENSLIKIKVKCDKCGKEIELRFQDYQKSTNKQTTEYHCYNCRSIKYKQTCLTEYGVENISQLENIKQQKIITCIKNYFVDNPSKSIEIKNKKIETCLKNNGTKYPTQNSEIFSKILKNGLKYHKYKNTNLFYQCSYEKDFLDKYYNIVEIENGKSIKYEYENENCVYHSDFFLPKYNLIVEIKSSYWYDYDKNRCNVKENKTKLNYDYIMILNKDYEKINLILKNNNEKI